MMAIKKVKREFFFKLIIAVLPFVFIALIEALLRVVNYGDDYSLFVNSENEKLSGYKICNPDVGKKYFQKLDYTSSANDYFLKEKPDNGFRIFVMGSSTVAGFPYERNLRFTTILQKRLQDMYPAKTVEVVNVAMTAIGSFTLLDITDDILREKPDAILFYAGHNEFYGALGIASNERMASSRFLTLAHLRFMDFRFYQLLRNAISGATKLFSGHNSGKGVRGTLMTVIANDKPIGYKTKLYNTAIENYSKNLAAVLNRASEQDIPVFLSELVCNIRDLKPFSSVESSRFPLADSVFNEAKKLDGTRQWGKAMEAYLLARDLDGTRFRASEDINKILRGYDRAQGIYLVQMNKFFEDNSEGHLMGNNLFTEHVHPNIEGQFLMAEAFYQSIVKSKLIGNYNPVNYHSSAYYKRNWGYTSLDSLVAVHKINSLKRYWPFQPIGAEVDDYSYFALTLVDSLAFSVFEQPKVELLKALQKMAGKNFNSGNFEDSFKEFYAITLIDPLFTGAYLGAIESLIRNDDYTDALYFIESLLDIEDSFYARYYKALILNSMGEYIQAVDLLKPILGKGTDNERQMVLKQLYIAYLFGGNSNMAVDIIQQIQKLNPGFNPEDEIVCENILSHIPLQVKDNISLALEYLGKGDKDEALRLMLQSLKIKDTPLANRIVGEIFFSRNDNNAILYLLRAFPYCKNDPDYLYNLCLYNINVGDANRANQFLKMICDLNPGYPGIKSLREKIDKIQNS